MTNTKVASAVRWVIAASAASIMGPAGLAAAQAQAAGSKNPDAVDLSEVVVTGSRIRRVETETASPLLVIDEAAIEQSGYQVLGDLLQRIPEVAGFFVNPQLGNLFNGSGATGISLRGLGAGRTLVLLDGRRLNEGGVDVNQIPINLIERVEVLKEGAGAIYGSDAVGGVVNFITKKPADGLEVKGDFGQTTHSDGRHHSFSVTFGSAGERSQILIGGNYNQQDKITAGQRAYSRNALYLYSGVFTKGGTSNTPTGRIFLPASLQSLYGCSSVTRGSGAAGTSLTDFGCYGSGGAYAGPFNFQPFNLLLSPQERAGVFFKGTYQINEHVEAYTDFIYNRTRAGFGLSPASVLANSDEVLISKDSIYNPFGVDFGGGAAVGGANTDARMLLSVLGPRYSVTITDAATVFAGLRGAIPGTDWRWDFTLGFNSADQSATAYGYASIAAMNAAFGPSYYASNGTPTCGTPAQPISNCVPANFFNLGATPAALANLAAPWTNTGVSRDKAVNLDFNGNVLTLPGGTVAASVGFDYLGSSGSAETSAITQSLGPDYTNCGLSASVCSSPFSGSYHVREVYAELFVPLLKDLPGAKALNVDVGTRYSDYSLAGNTTRTQFKVEYRPVSDLLIRGTFAQVFRAPGISDLFAGPSGANVGFTDPCVGFTGAATALYPHLPAACAGVPTDGSFRAITAQVPTLSLGDVNLKPETGYVATAGFVFNPRWMPGFSASVDYWRTRLNNEISGISPDYAITQCAVTGATEFCDLAHRYASGPNAGQFIVFNTPTFNLGAADIRGIDFDFSYELHGTPLGSWRAALDVTHLSSYLSTSVPGAAAQQIVGTFDPTLGNLTKNRATASLGWSAGRAETQFAVQYIGSLELPFADGSVAADGTFYYRGLHIPAVTYLNWTAGYEFPTNTKVQVGIYNLTDKTPPIFGEGWATAGGITDSATYDEIGRRFTLSVVQRF